MLSVGSTAFAAGATHNEALATDPTLDPTFSGIDTSYEGSTNFRVHYALTGAHAVPSAGYAAQVAAVLEEVYTKIGDMGYKDLLGASDKYNVYLKNVGSIKGEVQAYSIDDTSRSFMVLDNNYTEAQFASDPIGFLKSSAAHQLFIAFQMGYNTFASDDFFANIWWKEASAAWMEDEIYPNLNHYLNNVYTNDPGGSFASPDFPLEDMDFTNVMFVKFIAQKAGGGANGQLVIRKIWETLEGKDFGSYPTTTVFKYIISTLKAAPFYKSTTINNLVADYAVQNFVVDPSKTPGATIHYSPTDANDLTDKHNALWSDDGPFYSYFVKAENINSATANKTADDIAFLPQYLGANYNVVNASSTTKTVKLQFNGGLAVEDPSINPEWMVKILLRRVDNGEYDIKSLVTNGRSGELTQTGFGASGTYNQAVFVVIPVTPSNLDIGGENTYQYSYSLRNASSILKYSYSGSSTIRSTTYYYGSSTGIIFRALLREVTNGSALNNKTPVPILEKSTTGLANSWTTADAAMSWNSTLKRYVSGAQKPSKNMYYRVRWPGTDIYADSVSGKSRIYVVPKITIKAADYSISKGSTVKISGIVSPNHAGKNVYVQIFDGSKWTTLSTKGLNSSSAYGIFWTPTKKGKFGFRTRFGDSDHKMSYSKTINIVVN